MPIFGPPRDFCERGSHISLPSTESDFHIPDDAERLTLSTRRRTTKRVERIQREIDRLTLTRKIEEIVRKIDTNRETTQYLLITNLSDTLRDYLLNKKIDGVRLTVDDHNILLRIMPSMQHECIISDFCILFADSMSVAGLLRRSDGWRGTGAAQRKGLHCAKEPDFSIVPKPHSLSTTVSPWPSFIIEIGLSESECHFHKDVKWWFDNSDHNTGLVLLFKVHREPFWVDVELWSRGLQINSQSDSLVLKQSLRVTRDEVTLLEGSSLDIHLDYEILMREAQPSRQKDIIITQQMLRFVCEEVS
ncbi:unnamed protein product [Penicillium camemberti]|uniref:Str. FM013 n=1 Tax=Penicillium camemberti (strain FM 013) TaxID=1429867 RepID=A0A0G4PV66_PENC3|nr:unnamed protein product [Penicillium camemberti]